LIQLRKFSIVNKASPCWCHCFRRASVSCAAVGIAGFDGSVIPGLLKMGFAFLLGGALSRVSEGCKQSFARATEKFGVQGRSPGQLPFIFQRADC
jgi:hypothetical protein